MVTLGNKYEMGACNLARFLRSSLVAIIVVFFFYPPTLPAVVKTPAKCKSVSLILENQSACHGHFVRLTGHVVDLKRTDKWTKFQLSDGASKLNVFNFGDQPIRGGDCAIVEGVYYFQRTQIDTHHFENEIRWEKVEPCSRPAKEKGQPSTVKGGKQGGWDWRLLSAIGVAAIIVVLALLERAVLAPRRYRRIGKEFEEYVVSLFPSAEWEIEDRSSDTSHTMGRRILGDVAYDWIIRHRPTSHRCILQCKYRSRFFRNGVEWAKSYQMRNYKDFQRSKAYDYYVILGVGGASKQPDHLYAIRLQRLDSTFVRRRELEPYARDPRAVFVLDDRGNLR
jgi:hypothetical protein